MNDKDKRMGPTLKQEYKRMDDDFATMVEPLLQAQDSDVVAVAIGKKELDKLRDENLKDFERELVNLVNRHSIDTLMDDFDYNIAAMLCGHLKKVIGDKNGR